MVVAVACQVLGPGDTADREGPRPLSSEALRSRVGIGVLKNQQIYIKWWRRIKQGWGLANDGTGFKRTLTEGFSDKMLFKLGLKGQARDKEGDHLGDPDSDPDEGWRWPWLQENREGSSSEGTADRIANGATECEMVQNRKVPWRRQDTWVWPACALLQN